MKIYVFLIIFILASNVDAWNSFNHKALADKVYYSLDFETQSKLNLTLMEEGAVAPDLVFHDVRLHHYPPSYNKSLFWLEKARNNYLNNNYNNSSYEFGVVAHYVSDSFVAPHYIAKEPGKLHSEFENLKTYKFSTKCHNNKIELELKLIEGSRNYRDWGLWIVNKTYEITEKEIEQALYTLYPLALETFNATCNNLETEITKKNSVTGLFTWFLDLFK